MLVLRLLTAYYSLLTRAAILQAQRFCVFCGGWVVRILIDTWTSRNLDEKILVKIANDVLGVKVPGGWK
jgi:hypothetical protein